MLSPLLLAFSLIGIPSTSIVLQVLLNANVSIAAALPAPLQLLPPPPHFYNDTASLYLLNGTATCLSLNCASNQTTNGTTIPVPLTRYPSPRRNIIAAAKTE
jgi:hypothetical protein